jgi:DNA polymerase-3 subunit alpha
MSDNDIDWLRNALVAYAEYGFNLSHAVSYARVAYVSAWLLTHHPAVYWASLISQYGHKADDVRAMRKAAREYDNLSFIRAHVNYSKMDLVANESGTAIIESLTSIKGIGENVAEEIARHSPYTSVLDMAERCDKRIVSGSRAILAGHTPDAAPGKVKILHEAGALEAMPVHPDGWKKEK